MTTNNQLSMNFTAELIELVKKYEGNTDSHLYCQVLQSIREYGSANFEANDNLQYIRDFIKYTPVEKPVK